MSNSINPVRSGNTVAVNKLDINITEPKTKVLEVEKLKEKFLSLKLN
ncbi:MAG: hypothetical protein R2771_03935 [Saprospiraceae bacterium]